jgi:hypothetical protein
MAGSTPFTWDRFGLGPSLKGLRQRLAERQTVERDETAADQARQLKEIVAHQSWPAVQAIFFRTHDLYLERVKEGVMHIDALKALEDCYRQIDGSIKLGERAMERLVRRRFAESEATEAARDAGVLPTAAAVRGPGIPPRFTAGERGGS